MHKFLAAATVATICAATPASAQIVLDLTVPLSTTPSPYTGQPYIVPVNFAPTDFPTYSTFEITIHFAPGQSLMMIDDPSYPAVFPEMVVLDMEFADNQQRTVRYTEQLLGVVGDYDNSTESHLLYTRSTGPNLVNDLPWNITNSSFSFTGVRWVGQFFSPDPGITLSNFNFYVMADHVDVIQAAAVPELGSWALMIAGFGVAGAALRRRPRVAYA